MRRILITLSLVALVGGLLSIQRAPVIPHDGSTANRAAWYRVVQWPESCEFAFRQIFPADDSPAPLVFFAFGASRYLVRIPCTVGAYQTTYTFALYTQQSFGRHRIVPLQFSWFGRDQHNMVRRTVTDQLTGENDFSSTTGELHGFAKTRALGDCGVRYRYRINTDGTTTALRQAHCACNDSGLVDTAHPARTRCERLPLTNPTVAPR